jgi:limonene-1,2-epoxide hydrolase
MTTFDPVAIVKSFCAAWASHDLERVMSPLHDRIVWENVPLGIVAGKEAVREKLARVFARSSRLEWVVHDIALSPNGRVLTERLDIVEVDGRRIDIRIMGIFELAQGRITLWRDYFDLEAYKRDMAGVSW